MALPIDLTSAAVGHPPDVSTRLIPRDMTSSRAWLLSHHTAHKHTCCLSAGSFDIVCQAMLAGRASWHYASMTSAAE